MFGQLPEPWLPAQPPTPSPEESSTTVNGELPQAVKDALVVIDLGRSWRKFKRGVKKSLANATGGNASSEDGHIDRRGKVRRGWSTASSEGSEADPSRAWRGTSEEPPTTTTNLRGSYGHGNEDDDEDEDDEEEEEPTSR